VTDLDLSDIPAEESGDAFEQRCFGLLRRKYAPEDLVFMPAEMGGDCGIEGYSADGIVYQCYADQDSANLRHRTDKQKRKLYNDTEKLKKNKERLVESLGGMIVKYYIFFVPQFHAVELVQYAQKRAEVVRGYNLPFIHEDFVIRVKTPGDYPAELAAAIRDDSVKVLIPEIEIEDLQLRAFEREKPTLIETLEGKIKALTDAGWSVDEVELRDSLVRAFLEKEQMMAKLRDWPTTWEAIESRRKHRQSRLEIENALDSTPGNERVLNLIRDYGGDLAKNVGGVTDTDAQRLSTGQVGEWLLRCPLRLRAPK
jgi:hypothetical protein